MRFIAIISLTGLLCVTTISFGRTPGSARILRYTPFYSGVKIQSDTSKKKKIDTVGGTEGTLLKLRSDKNPVFSELNLKANSIDPQKLVTSPAVSLQQYLKGQAAGLYIQEPSGEPGTIQSMFIHGASQPLLSAREQFQTQPLIVLDGIPLIGEHPFAFDIQQYKFNRIGPATNLLTNIDMENIASVQVLTDIASIAAYGPKGVNGVIVLTSKTPSAQKQISFNSYVSVGLRPQVTTLNGKYENNFRKQFYYKYTPNGRFSDDEVYPLYLSDSLSSSYYGPSNWSDLYYRNPVSHTINAAISGGAERANFRFSLGNVRNEGIADQTALNRYSTMLNVNMKPLEWLTFSASVNANRVERDRNNSLRDRFSQMNYIPDLSSPFSPNKDIYSGFLKDLKNGYDDNKSNIVEGAAVLSINLGNFLFTSHFGMDYNEGYRDIYYSKVLLEGNSYASNYYGFNQRLMFNNTASYDLKLNEVHNFRFELGQSVHYDTYKYNYAFAYKGTNDYIKLNLLNSDPALGGDGSEPEDYLYPLSFPKSLTFKYLDKTKNNMLSFFGKTAYNFDSKYTLSFILRADASTNAQPTSRWFVSPAVSASWNIKNDLLTTNSSINELSLRVSAGRLGRAEYYDNFAQGPQYTTELGYTGNLLSPGYNAFAVLTRPYNYGWVGYGIPWSYTDQLNVGADVAVLNNRLRMSLDFYTKTDKNQLLAIPDYAEYGYTQSYESGLSVNNKGIDLTLSGDVISNDRFKWTPSLNLNYNINKLVALPRGLKEIAIGDRLFKVGHAIDQYWLYTNDGMYNTNEEVPVVGGVAKKFNGITLGAGDPNWRDLNNDNAIDDNDKTLRGHALPVVAGSFNNDFKYGKWTLGMQFYFNLGREVINQEMSNHFNFINQESGNTINSVKEITFWEKRGDFSKYPLYNPWSPVIPYRVDQDLFLENASFLKLRTVSLGYELTDVINKKRLKLSRLYIYGTANNLFTITPYTGQDPELVNYTGYDRGFGMPYATTFTLGVKMDL